MNRYIAAVALAGMLAFPTVGHASSLRPGSGNGNGLGNNGNGNGNSGAHGCKLGSQGYVSSNGKCYHVPPAGGELTINVPGSGFVLQGAATRATAGHQVGVTQVAPPVSKPKGDWIRVQSDGSFPPLYVRHAVIYQYDPATGKLKRVNAITQPGIYLIVPSF
jgi:hypothetical protein